jgi:hypothetical protein
MLGPRTCLLGLTAALLYLAACGQGEGGRCQVSSDCASGLICDSTTGNGKCVSPNASANDAAPSKDSAVDVPIVSTSEVGADTLVTPKIDSAEVDSTEGDATPADATPAEVDATPAEVDAGVVDVAPAQVDVGTTDVAPPQVDVGTADVAPAQVDVDEVDSGSPDATQIDG